MSLKPLASTITISKEDGKLIVVRKLVLPSRLENCFGCFIGCFWLFLACVLIIFIVSIILLFSMGEDEAYSFLIGAGGTTIIVFFAAFILATRDSLRNGRVVRPPDYEDEILTFDIDKFVVQYQGKVHTFSYRDVSAPMMQQSPIWPELMDVVIPGISLDGHDSTDVMGVDPSDLLGTNGIFYDPSSDLWEIYTISFINSIDAERILAALKEYLKSITKLE